MSPVALTCKTCGKLFTCPPSVAKKGRQFCSKHCARVEEWRLKAKPPLPDRQCAWCEESFRPRNEGRHRFCSVECRAKGCGKENPTKIREAQLIRLGEAKPDTYKKFHGRHVHRVIAEQKVGRSLLPDEVVHHIDGDKHNNSPENLQVIESQAEHARIHALERHHPKEQETAA